MSSSADENPTQSVGPPRAGGRKDCRQVLEQEAEALHAVQQASDPLARARLTVDHARKLLDMDGAALYWWDTDAATLHLLIATDLGALSLLPVWHAGQGVIGRAFQQGTPVVGDESTLWAQTTSASPASQDVTVLAVPLQADGQVRGILAVHSATPRPIGPDDVRLLVALAAQLVPAADALQGHARWERQRIEATVLADLVRQGAAEPDPARAIALITRQACRVLGGDYATVGLAVPDGRVPVLGMWGMRTDAWRTQRYQPGKGAAARALAGRTTLVVERLGESPAIPADEFLISRAEGGRTVLSTPLISGGRDLGSLVVGWRCDVTLAPAQVYLAETLASYAATIIDNAQAHAAAAAHAAELTAVIAQLPSGVLVTDAAGQLRLANHALSHIFGAPPDPTHAPTDPTATAQLREPQTGRHLAPDETPLGRALRGETVPGRDLLFRRAGEEQDRWLRASATPLRDAEGRIAGAIGVVSDVTQERTLLRQLAVSEAQLRTVYDVMRCGIVIQDAAGQIIDANEAAQGILGLPLEQLRGRTLPQTHQGALRPDGSELPLAQRPSQMALSTHAAQRSTVLGITRMDDQERWLQVETVPVLDDDGALQQIVTSFIDITERQQVTEALAHQALHDTLTGLPNRTLLQDRVQQAILAVQRHTTTTAQMPSSLALLLLDLDRFKEVNDTFGHPYGDLLLQEVARRLSAVLRGTDTVARLGGDEFAMLLSETDQEGAMVTAGRIEAALDAPYAIAGQPLHVGASLGIALYPLHGQDGATLLRRADVAMYVAKRGQDRVAIYAPEQDTYTPDRLILVAEMREAIARGALLLHYQPKVAVDTGRVIGVEALARWTHEQRGVIPPDVFIPLAEQTGLITALTLWILEAALRQCQRWHRAGWPLSVAVNLSTTNLHDRQLPDIVAQLLRTHTVHPASLRLEVTESMLMADTARAQEVLTRLANLGVGLSVDDYGTGYSSLAYLKRLPVDELKIDRSFVQQMAEDVSDAAIIASTIGLGHSLGLTVVAEGVENEQSWKQLAALGCDAAQGYYLSRPLAAADLEQWLAAAPRM